MRISDVVTIKPAAEAVSLLRLQELRDMLDREGEGLSLLSGAAVEQILQGYVTPPDPAGDPLYRFLKSVAANGGRGAGFLVRGPRNAGKSHLLAVAALLLEYPRLRPIFAAGHPGYHGLLSSLSALDPVVVVAVPLEEHRAHDEHLEDIIFDRTEAELRRPRYGMALPLSEQSHALDLIERHIVPRYGAELDAHVARLPGTQRSWRDLVERNPSAAVGAARGFAQEIGYPLDFRQSRVERMARLLDIVNHRHYKAIVWLVDDLGQFLAASGQKAVRNDAAFLEFMGQRSRIAPLYVLGTMSTTLDQTVGIEPYMLSNIQDTYEGLALSAADLRRINHQRAMTVPDGSRLEQALTEICEAHDRAFGERSFSLEDLRASYPLSPLAATCLEAIYHRFLSEADAFADILQMLAAPGSRQAYLDRDYRQLLSLADVLGHLTHRLSAHPQAAAYLGEALEFYDRSGPGLLPEDPDLPGLLARQLVGLRLANMAVPVGRLVEDLGCRPDGSPRATETRVREALEQMRLRGRFVDLRRGATAAGDTYVVDVEANFTEMARRHLVAYKAALTDDDPRLWETATTVLSASVLPLAELAEPMTLQVTWCQTRRSVLAQTTTLIGLSAERLSARCAELADAGTPADLRLHVADLTRPGDQRRAWREAGAGLPRGRWAAGVLAWIPRALTGEELDRIKELAACRALLHDSQPQHDPKLTDRLSEEATRLAPEVRSLVETAYVEGEVLSGEGTLLGPAELAMCRGDWPATLVAIAAAALTSIYPHLADHPPLLPLTPRDDLDDLIAHVLTSTGRVWDDDGRLGELIGAYLVPLELVVRHGEGWLLAPENSPAAQEIMARVRRRDQTAETEPGRPSTYGDLARYMAKTEYGLSEELFELVLAALIRGGLLLPLTGDRQPIGRLDLVPPLLRQVAFVCRAPLLAASVWQDLARLTRVFLERMIPRPDHALQTDIWEELVARKDAEAIDLTRLTKVLAVLRGRLGQAPAAWQETTDSLDALRHLLDSIDPTAYPAAGLTAVLAAAEPLLGGAPSRLSTLIRYRQALDAFLEATAPGVVQVNDYLRSDELVLPDDTDLTQRRQQLLEIIAGGERLLTDETTFRRLVQIFMTVYRRRYTAWHARSYRASVFDRYRALRQAPEFRVLADLQRLEIPGADRGSRALELLEAQEARRCSYVGLAEALDESPVCPDCHLKLEEEPQLVPLDEIRLAAEAEISAYATHLRRPGFQTALREYVTALPGRGDLPMRLEQVLNLGDDPPARALLAILNDDVVVHLNRVLSGKTIRPRDFAELRAALAGRTLSRDEAQTLFMQWISGDDAPGGDEIIHVEP